MYAMNHTDLGTPPAAATTVTTENSDWATNCPEYKVTAVQAVRVAQPLEWRQRQHTSRPQTAPVANGAPLKRMNVERLVTMANDIAAFFAADPDRGAAAGVAQLSRSLTG